MGGVFTEVVGICRKHSLLCTRVGRIWLDTLHHFLKSGVLHLLFIVNPSLTSSKMAKKNRQNGGYTAEPLPPRGPVESLIYWRDPKKSGIVFGIVMVSLLSLIYYSLISVIAYLCLFTLGGTITFRVYKNVMQAVQKTSDGHPFKEFLDIDLTIPEDKVNEVSQCLVQYLNKSLTTLRSLFLVEDLIDSIKFVIIFWVFTYIGACFNGLTLIIIGVILLFTLPKIYENNKAQIDVYIKMAMDKLSIITSRMKAAVPEGKKDDKPKDQ